LRGLGFCPLRGRTLYIPAKDPTTRDYVELGSQLAALHQQKSDIFGWESDNFIGNLHQSNKHHKEWTSFYLEERIWPQLLLAKSKNLLSTIDLPNKEQLYLTCKKILAGVQPSLLHGDLWSGNYLISSDGIPYLIDPATYFGDHKVDIAMSKLFGGFDSAFYNAYWEHFARTEKENKYNDLYQLYYLIVHLNLFGSSYYNSVKRILSSLIEL
jgi:protein-ribulosamine 3-kinase